MLRRNQGSTDCICLNSHSHFLAVKLASLLDQSKLVGPGLETIYTLVCAAASQRGPAFAKDELPCEVLLDYKSRTSTCIMGKRIRCILSALPNPDDLYSGDSQIYVCCHFLMRVTKHHN